MGKRKAERKCYLSVNNSGDPEWDGPTYLQDTDFLPIHKMALQVLTNADFFDRTGFDGVVVFLNVGPTFPDFPSVQLTTSKAHGAVIVSYSLGTSEVPDIADRDRWKNTAIRYLADGLDRVLTKFKFDKSGIQQLLMLADSSHLINPGDREASCIDDTSVEISLVLAFDSRSRQDAKEELKRFHYYADEISDSLERSGLASFLAEESTGSEHFVSFKTDKAEETTAAIVKLSNALVLPASSYVEINDNGSKTRISLREKA